MQAGKTCKFTYKDTCASPGSDGDGDVQCLCGGFCVFINLPPWAAGDKPFHCVFHFFLTS